MSQTIVGNTLTSVFGFRDSSGLVTTGTVTIVVGRGVAGGAAEEYLQGDLTSWGGTPPALSATLVGSRWVFSFDVPTSAKGNNIWVRATHSVLGDLTDGPYYVTSADIDDVAAEDTTITIGET